MGGRREGRQVDIMQMVHNYLHVTWLHAWEGRPVLIHGQCHLYSSNAAVIPTYLYITEFEFSVC